MKISTLSRILSAVGAIALTISLFVPLWRIELDAPQYPEGLALLIYPNDIKGDVDIINGLNHYIGMQTLHPEKFIEFTILQYIIGFYALLCLSITIVGNKKLLNWAFAAFVLFGIVSMIDFWRWEYNYGHNLDPNAAIQVPGMSYQPPLIGFKQLLNFGAFSIPDIGGWLFIGCGACLFFAVGYENKWLAKLKNRSAAIIITGMLLSCLTACTEQVKPVAIKLNKDECAHCKMTLTDARFAVELITPKNRIYTFDDIACLKRYLKENTRDEKTTIWISDYQNQGQFVKIEEAFFVQSNEIHSPMGGHTIAFAGTEIANEFALKYATKVNTWNQLQP